MKRLTAAKAKKLLLDYETYTYNPVMAVLREGRHGLPETMAHWLMKDLQHTHISIGFLVPREAHENAGEGESPA